MDFSGKINPRGEGPDFQCFYPTCHPDQLGHVDVSHWPVGDRWRQVIGPSAFAKKRTVWRIFIWYKYATLVPRGVIISCAMARTKATDKPDPAVRGKRKANGGDSENAMQERRARAVRRTPLSEQPAKEVMGFEAIELDLLNSFALSDTKTFDTATGREKYGLSHYGERRPDVNAHFENLKFERAVNLMRSLAFGDCTWTQEHHNVFLNSVLTLFDYTSINKCYSARRLRDAVFRGLDPEQILVLLNELLRVHNGDRFDQSFYKMRRYWFMDYRSIRAMSVEHLKQISKLLFDGVNDMLSVAYHNKDETDQFHNKIETIKYIIEDPDKKEFFFGTCPDPSFGVSFELAKKMMFMDHTPATLDFLADSIRALIDTGGAFSDAVQRWLFQNIYTRYLDEHTRTALLNRVYDTRKPPSECWTVLLFHDLPSRKIAHEWIDSDEMDVPIVDSGDSIQETPFCKDCQLGYDESFHSSRVSCRCHTNLKLDVVDFLLKKRVEIPLSFWDHVAYFNLWHLAHFMHTNKPCDVDKWPYLSGLYDVSVIQRMIRYNSTGLAKFMMQYYGFRVTRVIEQYGSPTIWPGTNITPDITPQMEKILVPDVTEKRRSHLKECQAFLDENKDEMPENVYLQMCNLFKQSFNRL